MSTIDFSKLDTILTHLRTIENLLSTQVEKRWFNKYEAAEYLGYSTDSISSFVKSGEFIKGQHYHQKRKKLLFDRLKLDEWVISDSETVDKRIKAIIEEIQTDVA